MSGNGIPFAINEVVIRLADATKIIQLPDGMYLVDFARLEYPLPQRVILFISMSGSIEYYTHNSQTKWGFKVVLDVPNQPPPKEVFDIADVVHTETISMKEAFERAKEIAMQTIVFDDERLYDLLVAWCMYTWVRGLFPKNVNLYVTGFPGTGKSQVLHFIKYFARYPTYFDPSSDKSFKWHIAHTLGTLLIDEGEYLTRSSLAKLRKYHEADIIESRMVGLPMIGLTMIELRVDAPLAVAATHLPADTAFLQRGFLIRMSKRKPRIKDFNMVPGIHEFRKVFAKTVLCNWFVVFMSLQQVYEKLASMDLDERVKDLILPIATILDIVEKPWDWLIDFAQKSFSEANFVTPENMVFILALKRLRELAEVWNNQYVFSINDVYDVIAELSREFRAQASRVRYLLQYVFAGCAVVKCGDDICFACDKATVDHVIESSIPTIPINVERKRSNIDVRASIQIMDEDESEEVEVRINARPVRL